MGICFSVTEEIPFVLTQRTDSPIPEPESLIFAEQKLRNIIDDENTNTPQGG